MMRFICAKSRSMSLKFPRVMRMIAAIASASGKLSKLKARPNGSLWRSNGCFTSCRLKWSHLSGQVCSVSKVYRYQVSCCFQLIDACHHCALPIWQIINLSDHELMRSLGLSAAHTLHPLDRRKN